MSKGFLIVLSSPSGGGKTTVVKSLLMRNEFDFVYSVSATTRKPRKNEVHGKDYYFYSKREFLARIKENEFIEWENVHHYYYGTPRNQIERWMDEGKIALLDIDVNGGLKIKQEYPDQVITIFIAPPSLDELIKRLKDRQTDSDQEIQTRLQRVPLEMNKKNQFDYVVVNHNISDTVNHVLHIIKKHVV